MNRLIRVFLATAMVVGVSGMAEAETTWRMATKMPVDSPEGKVFQRFADLTKEYTGGELTIQVFPNEQLGKEDAVLEQMQTGIVNIYAEGFGYMRKWAPELSWISPAFVFDDYDHWVRFMDSELVKSWFAKATAESGVGPLGNPTAVLRGPFRVIVSNKPIETIDDVAALKLRMHPNKLAIATWSHLGAEVITLPWTEVYQSIQKDIVQSVNSPIALVESMRFNEVAPHISRHNEYWQSIGFMMNIAAYDALDDKTRDGLLRAYDEAGALSREIMGEVADKSIKNMVANGATYMELDTKPFVVKMQSFYEKMDETGELPDGFLEAVEAARAK
ncbi:TRAP transporter substrate-binding protein [Pelagibius sp. Alg239-R121]|uniref:TRAP transporter substrate-binding protein n=1 Tax=Pelagibius sp. Alg239-R121 TaxID=2993448 RepID=UPI0024A75D82|nr:TRAP transporter substrate-binding protein [Pelagibius sp. Alg239-R121]